MKNYTSWIGDSEKIIINGSVLQLVTLYIGVDARVTIYSTPFYRVYDVDRSLSGQRHPVLICH